MSSSRKLTVVLSAILATIVGALVLNPFSLEVIRTFRSESAISEPEVYEPVGEALALYCQSDQSLFPQSMGYAWLPEELNAVGGGALSISEGHAYVEMGGGFHHFGYHLVRDTHASSPSKNAWQLYLYSENSEDRHLKTFFLNSDRRVSPDELVQKVIAGYDRKIHQSPDNEEAYLGKIQTYLGFDRVKEARQASEAMLKAMPNEWWPVLVNALIVAVEISPAEGENVINQWVQKNENFFSYMDVAYFHQLIAQPKKAAAAMQLSTAHTANTDWGHGGNAEHRGYTAAMYAYQSAEYDTTINLCDHLLKVTINGNYAKLGIRNLRDAAVRAKQQPNNSPSVIWSSGIGPFDPFDSIDIEKLLGRSLLRKKKHDER